MCLSIDLWGLFLEHPKMAYVICLFCPLGSQRRFLPTFEEISTRNIFVSTSRMKTIKVWKVFLIFQTFRKFAKKGLGAPTKHPNLQMKLWQKIENFQFLPKFHLQVWVFCGCPKPFFWKFSESLKNFKNFSYLKCFHTANTSWDILAWILLKNRLQEFGKIWLEKNQPSENASQNRH